MAYLAVQLLKESTTHFRAREHFNLLTDITFMLLIIMSLIINRKTTFESITWHLKLGNANEAKDIFNQMSCDIVHPRELENEMNEKVEMLSEDYDEIVKRSGLGIFAKGNSGPLSVIALLRVLSIITYNPFLLAVTAATIDHERIYSTQQFIIFIRIIALAPARYLLDNCGRKHFYSFPVSEVVSVPLALQLSGNVDLPYFLLASCSYLLHVFASLGIEPIQHLYLVEAFPLSKRNASVAYVTCIEYVAYGLIMFLWLNNLTSPLNFMIIKMPFIVFVFTISLFVKLPETKGKSLRQCRPEFKDYYKKQ